MLIAEPAEAESELKFCSICGAVSRPEAMILRQLATLKEKSNRYQYEYGTYAGTPATADSASMEIRIQLPSLRHFRSRCCIHPGISSSIVRVSSALVLTGIRRSGSKSLSPLTGKDNGQLPAFQKSNCSPSHRIRSNGVRVGHCRTPYMSAPLGFDSKTRIGDQLLAGNWSTEAHHVYLLRCSTAFASTSN